MELLNKKIFHVISFKNSQIMNVNALIWLKKQSNFLDLLINYSKVYLFSDLLSKIVYQFFY